MQPSHQNRNNRRVATRLPQPHPNWLLTKSTRFDMPENDAHTMKLNDLRGIGVARQKNAEPHGSSPGSQRTLRQPPSSARRNRPAPRTLRTRQIVTPRRKPTPVCSTKIGFVCPILLRILTAQSRTKMPSTPPTAAPRFHPPRAALRPHSPLLFAEIFVTIIYRRHSQSLGPT
jgi:hypothetical protein